MDGAGAELAACPAFEAIPDIAAELGVTIMLVAAAVEELTAALASTGVDNTELDVALDEAG